jgi:radical SAM-linked protein
MLVDCLPDTIPIYRVEEVDLKAHSATQAVQQAEYRLTFAPVENSTDWQNWVNTVLASSEILFEQTTKNGKKKVVNLRDRLLELELVNTEPTIQIRYIGSCQNDGTILRPEHITFLLEFVSGQSLQLQRIHRERLLCELLTDSTA